VSLALKQLIPLERIAPEAVDGLLDAAFGTDRKGRTAYRMRDGVEALPGLSFAAVDGAGHLMGSIQCWPVALEEADGTRHSLVLVGPVAVLPELQGAGIGKAMMQASIDAADSGLADALMMIGDPEYYGRFWGFTADATGAWEIPGPVERRRLLARIKRPGGVPVHGRIIPDPAHVALAA